MCAYTCEIPQEHASTQVIFKQSNGSSKFPACFTRKPKAYCIHSSLLDTVVVDLDLGTDNKLSVYVYTWITSFGRVTHVSLNFLEFDKSLKKQKSYCFQTLFADFVSFSWWAYHVTYPALTYNVDPILQTGRLIVTSKFGFVRVVGKFKL